MSAGPDALAGDLIITLEGVCKNFCSFRALNNINLQVRRGERIVICGPSGSGKSTLIRCINQLEHHQIGRIVFDGTEVGPHARRAAGAKSAWCFSRSTCSRTSPCCRTACWRR
jgi:ABC-type polar amino acid transport system ATPase subunit